MGPTYWDYLRLDELLKLQSGLEGDEARLMPDELHFVVVHQAFELWFKLILRELRLARDHLAEKVVREENVPYVVHHLRRINTILELAIDQFRVMETLTPQDFLAFRDKLTPASGFQSFQMREIELLLGLDPRHAIAVIRAAAPDSRGGQVALQSVESAAKETSLRAALHAWLERTPIQGSSPRDPGDTANVRAFIDAYLVRFDSHGGEQVERFAATGVMSREVARAQLDDALGQARKFLLAEDIDDPGERTRMSRIRAAVLFIESYRDLPLLAWPRVLLDAIVELEELMVLWRTRHARMVERIIGRRVGTGGSQGVDYLDKTTAHRIFTELWTVRTVLLPRSAAPALARPEVYAFASD